MISDRLKKMKVKPADRGDWKRGQRNHWVGEKKKKKENLRPLIYIRFNSSYRIEKKKEREFEAYILGKQRTN